jgi:hypothetical protein
MKKEFPGKQREGGKTKKKKTNDKRNLHNGKNILGGGKVEEGEGV